MTTVTLSLAATVVFDLFDQPVSIFAADGTYVYVNPAGLDLIGKSLADVLSKKYVDLFPDLLEHPYHQAFLRVSSGEVLTERLEFCHEPLGLWSSQHIYLADGFVVVHWENITARKHAEQELKQALAAAADSESLFRSMIEWMPQLTWCAKPDGFIDYYSPRWYEYTGTTPAEMEGWGWQSVHDPHLLPSVMKRWEHSIASGELFEMEFPLRRHDGAFHWFLTRVRPMRNGVGKIIRWIGINTDIHEQKLTQEALERERIALKRLLRNVPVVINFLRGPELIFEVAHPLTVKALGREVEGMPLLEVQPEGRDRSETLRHVFESGESRAGVEMLVTIERNGEPVDTYWNFTYLPVRDASGIIEGVMTCEVEVTDQVRARKDVERARHEAEIASRAKDEFLAMLGHELRNPLAPIQTALQLIRLQGSSAHERERSVIERQVTHLVRLVDDLLDVSRITRGKVQLTREHIEIAEVAARALEAASPLFEKGNLALVVEVPRYGLVVDADPARLAQAVSNLLNNAAKYSAPGGRVTLAAQREGSEVVVRVVDLGGGISPELLPKVFDLFSQGQQTIDRAQGGLGIGLAIVRSLVELHGGRVSAQSEGRDRGSTFTIRLPAVVVGSAGVNAQLGQNTRTFLPAKGMRVLVVDDNQDAADLIGEALQALGYVVCVNYDGTSALAAVETFRPDVAVLDIGLPVMDGYELAQRLRQHPECKGIRLIAVTGYGQQSDRDRARQAGFDEHLVKPVNMKALASAIKHEAQ